jgi:hypothetical protein
MSDLSDFTVKIRNDRDIIISKPEAGFEVMYRREMYSPILIASDVLCNDFDESKVTRERGMDWTPATLPRVAQETWSTLVTLGYVEERRDGEDRRFLRLTEKGSRAADGHR